MNGKLSIALIIVFLISSSVLAQSEDVDEPTFTLESGEIASYELVISELFETVREGKDSSRREVSVSIDFPAAGEYLILWIQLRSALIETNDLDQRYWYSMQMGQPTGDCRNLAFDTSHSITIFLNCPASISLTFASASQFVALQVLRISGQPPFAEPGGTTLSTSETEGGKINLNLNSGRNHSSALLYSEVIKTVEAPRSYGANYRDFRTELRFFRSG